MEMTAGRLEDPSEILSKRFSVGDCDEMIILRDVAFSSVCEHHLLPFSGTATVGYIPAPGQPVVGLSKLARLVDCFSRRLQVQERLTSQVAGAVRDHLQPVAAGCVVRASHQCMTCRGVKKSGAEMVTSSMHGKFRTCSDARSEFLGLA